MSSRVIGLGFFAGAVLFVSFAAARILGSAGPVPAAVAPVDPLPTVSGAPAGAPAPTASGTRAGSRAVPADPPPPDAHPPRGFRTYALEVVELQGLPPDAPPGTVIDVWVAWEPPVTRRPRFQLLLQRVEIERLIPAGGPDLPATVLLRLAADDVPDMLWGDRFGSLNAAVHP